MSRARVRAQLERLVLVGGAPLAIATAGVPVLAAAAWVAIVLDGPPSAALEARAVRLWAAALALALGAGIARAVLRRSPAAALACAALLAATGQLAAGWALRFEGTAEAGVGEPAPPWREVVRGPLAATPALEVADASEVDVAVRLDGRAATLVPGTSVEVGGHALVAGPPAAAPAFEVVGPGGAVEASGLLKLGTGAGDLLQISLLPHRFQAEIAPPAPGAPADPPLSPSTLRLRVFRGKLKVLDRAIAKDEPVAFDGLGFRFGDGSAWVPVRVRRVVPRHLGALAVLLAALSAAAALRRRRGARP